MGFAVGDKVRAIQNKPGITYDKVYVVKAIWVDSNLDEMIMIETNSPGVYSYSFELYEEVSVEPVKPKAIDEEVRLRAIFTAPQVGHCKCGMLISVCEYHRL